MTQIKWVYMGCKVPGYADTLDWQGNGWYAGDVTNGQGVSLNSLKTAIDLLGQFHAAIVETLPEETISTGTIHMILKPTGGATGDIYD